MNAEAFRYFYNYHFAENRRLWDRYIAPLPYELFVQEAAYSHGRVRDQIVHLLDVDDVWFSELQNLAPFDPIPEAAAGDDRAAIRAHWDRVEQKVRAYLASLQDEMLFTKPIQEPDEDQNLIVWQVLLHVVNHATDHRAQILRQLTDLGVETASQDFIFYVYDHP